VQALVGRFPCTREYYAMHQAASARGRQIVWTAMIFDKAAVI